LNELKSKNAAVFIGSRHPSRKRDREVIATYLNDIVKLIFS